VLASPIASSIVRPEHELPAQQLDRAHGGGHHGARAQALQQAGRVAPSPSGRKRLDSAMALADRLASMRCGPSAASLSKSARPSWSAVNAIAVSASGTRSSASASRIRARPSALLIGYSRSSAFHGPERRRRRAHRMHPGRGHGRHAGPVQALQASSSAVVTSASGR
jgi:hypothetical protein